MALSVFRHLAFTTFLAYDCSMPVVLHNYCDNERQTKQDSETAFSHIFLHVLLDRLYCFSLGTVGIAF